MMLLLQFQQPVLMLHQLQSVSGSVEELFWCNNLSIQALFPNSSVSSETIVLILFLELKQSSSDG